MSELTVRVICYSTFSIQLYFIYFYSIVFTYFLSNSTFYTHNSIIVLAPAQPNRRVII